MRCSFAHEDAAYVLGALAPADRLAFEQHLAGCKECTRAVRGLAGLPGLLSRIDPEVLAATAPDEPVTAAASAVDGPGPASSTEAAVPVPESVLPGLVRAARRSRRRRVVAAAGAAAAATALVTSLVVSQLPGGDPDGSAVPPTGSGGSTAEVETPMAPVGDVPVEAALVLEAVTWGTRLELTCTYDTALVRYQLPPSVDYVLVVRTRDGHSERVGSWRSVNGRTMRLTAGTAATAGEIAAVQVRTPDGRVVLTSHA